MARALWERFQARDWDGAAGLLSADFEAWWPHSRERFGGGGAFVGVNRAYPEPWTIRVLRVHEAGACAVVEVAVDHPGGVSYCASVAEVEDGRIGRLVEYWADDDHEPPAWREGMAERFERLEL